MDYKEEFKKLWERFFEGWRQEKFKIIDHIRKLKVDVAQQKLIILENLYSMEEDEYNQRCEILEEYKDMLEKYKELLKISDENALKSRFNTDSFIFNWLAMEFVKAIVDNSNIHYQRKMEHDYKLYEDREKRNNSILYIVQEIKNGSVNLDYHSIKDNFKVAEKDDKTEYSVLNQVLFYDSKQAKSIGNTLYHGTTLVNAKNIIEMNRLMPKQYDLTFSADELFNKDKIFFTNNIQDSKQYAKRFGYDKHHVIFEFDLSDYDLFERDHVVARREGKLYFLNVEEMEVKKNLVKIYLINENDEIKEINIEDMFSIENEKAEEEYKKIKEEKEKIIELKEKAELTKKKLKDKREEFMRFVIKTAKIKNISVEEVIEKYKNELKEKDVKQETINIIFSKELNKKENLKDIHKHLKYLEENELYDIVFNKDSVIVKNVYKEGLCIKESSIKKGYHGTSIHSAQKIMNIGYLKGLDDYYKIDYNKVFFTNDVNYSKMYGMMSGANTKEEAKELYIIFEVDLTNYNTYHYCAEKEYVVWGKVDAKNIVNIYLAKKDRIITKLSKEELMRL